MLLSYEVILIDRSTVLKRAAHFEVHLLIAFCSLLQDQTIVEKRKLLGEFGLYGKPVLKDGESERRPVVRLAVQPLWSEWRQSL